jgi:hypothetical protein
MTRAPTAVIGVGAPPTTTEAVIAAMAPAAAGSTLAAAPRTRVWRGVVITQPIRHRCGNGWATTREISEKASFRRGWVAD